MPIEASFSEEISLSRTWRCLRAAKKCPLHPIHAQSIFYPRSFTDVPDPTPAEKQSAFWSWRARSARKLSLSGMRASANQWAMLTYLFAGSSRGLRLLGALALSASCGIAEVEPGFQSVFDGRSLMGWEAGDPVYWSVEEGAITGRITEERPCATNQYLVWRGGELADFELKMESRLDGEGAVNGGFQFRSRLLPDQDVCGYQVDNNLGTPWLVRLYDEYGRHDLALRGQRTLFASDGTRTVNRLEPADGDPAFRLEDWHDTT